MWKLCHILSEENTVEVFMNPLFMEMITFTLRSTSADGVSLNINIEIPASFSLMEVMTRFRKKLSMSMQWEGVRCPGRSERSGQPNCLADSG